LVQSDAKNRNKKLDSLTFSPGFIRNEMKSTVENEINMIDEEQEYDLMNNETASISTNKYRTAGFSEPSI